MKKVLIVATVQSHIAQFHRPLADILHENGIEVHVAAKNNLAQKNGLKLDFADKVYDVPFSRSPKSLDNITAYMELKHILDTTHYDVVHCNTPMGGVVTRLAARTTRKRGTKVLYTAHGFHFYAGSSRLNWLVYYPIEKFLSKWTDTLITITEEDYHLARTKFACDVVYMHGVGVDEQRYHTCTLEERLQYRKVMGFSEDQKLILCIGELNKNKNQSMAIRIMPHIMKQYPNAILLLAGNGPMQQQLANEISRLGLQTNVRMLGYVTNLQDYQHVIDVQVCCSYREGLPLNVVESMLSGNSVVAAANRGHNELITDGKTGFIVPPNDADAMAERVLCLLGNEQLRQTITQDARDAALLYGRKSVRTELRRIYGL